MGMMAPGLIGHSQMEGILSQSICYSHWVNGAWNGVISIRQSSVFNHEKVGIWQSHLAAQKELLLPLSFLIIKLIKLNLSKLHYGPHFEPHCRTKCCVIRENNITAPIMNPIKETLVPLTGLQDGVLLSIQICSIGQWGKILVIVMGFLDRFLPYANFIAANFVSAVFHNYIWNLANAILCYCDHKIKIWLMRFFANANFG